MVSFLVRYKWVPVALALIVLVTALIGCASPFACLTGCVSPPLQPQYTYTPLNTTHIKHKVIVLEDDTPPLQKAQYFTQILNMLADRIDQAIVPGEDGIDVFVSAITSRSMQNDLLAFHVPAIPPDEPMPILQPVPSEADPGETPTHFADRAAAIQEANTKKTADWQAFLRTNHELLNQVKILAKGYTDKLRAIAKHPIVDPVRDDIYGALADASEYFSHFQSKNVDKLLLLSSPMQNNTAIDQTQNINLQGSIVRVVFFTCSIASSCDSLKAYWTKELTDFGAVSVSWYFPQDTIVENPTF